MQRLAIIALVSFVAGGATVKHYWPTLQERTKIEEKEVVRNNIKTVTRIVERPDGSRETITESTDRSTERSSRQVEQQKVAEKNWLLGITATTRLTQLQPIYGVQVSRRILGPFFIGVNINAAGDFGALIGAEL